MSDLRTYILTEARVEGDLLKVDHFLNHRVDTKLATSIGEDMAALLAPERPELVITIEASGIIPAFTTAAALGLPLIYAKKYPRTGARPSLGRTVTSPTKGGAYQLEVAIHVLAGVERVVVVDDFLSRGRTAQALGEILEEAGCRVAAMGFVIEKSFLHGRERLAGAGFKVESLLNVISLANGRIELE